MILSNHAGEKIFVVHVERRGLSIGKVPESLSRRHHRSPGWPTSPPSRERPIHLKTRLAFSPWRRATRATDAPAESASSTILRRSSTLQVRRGARSKADFNFAAIWCPPKYQVDA
jgi:hypothetical protein